MNIEKAQEIIEAWGKFLEVANPGLMRIFGAEIPEAILPFTKQEISDAVDLYIIYFQKRNNNDKVEIFKETKSWLAAYIDDKEAIDKASIKFNDPEFLKFFVNKYKLQK